MDHDPSDKDRIDQILRVDITALLKTIQNLENKLSQSPVPVNVPVAGIEAIFSRLESRLSALEIQQQQIYNNQAISPPSSMPVVPALNSRASFSQSSMLIAGLVNDDKMMAKLRGEIEAKINASQISFDSKVNSFAFEVDRLQKLLIIRPTTSELQQVIHSVNEMDRKMRDGVETVQTNLMGQLKNIVAGEMSSIMHEIKTTKVLNEQGIALVQKKIDAQSLDVADVKLTFQGTMDYLQPEIKRLKNLLAETDAKLSDLTKLSEEKEAESKAKIAQLEEAIAALQQATVDQKQEFSKSFEEIAEFRKQDAQTTRELIEQGNDTLTTAVKTLADLQGEFEGNRVDVEKRFFNLAAQTQEHSEKLELEANKRRHIHSIMDEIMKQDLQGKLAKHDEILNKLSYDLVDSRVVVDGLTALLNTEMGNIGKVVKTLEEDIKNKIKVAISQHSEKIGQLFQFDQVNKSNIEHLSTDVLHMEKTLESMLSLKPRVNTLEDICAVLDKDLTSSKTALTKVIDGNQDLARQLGEVSEKIDEIDESIVNRMNSVRDNLMEVLLEKQTETNLNLKNVRENLEVMAHIGDRGGVEGFEAFPPMNVGAPGKPTANVVASLKARSFKNNHTANTDDANSHGRHAQSEGSSGKGGSGGFNIVDSKDSPGTFRKPTMDGVLLKGLNIQPKQHQDDGPGGGRPFHSRTDAVPPSQTQSQHQLLHSQSQPLPPSSQVRVREKQTSEKIHGPTEGGENVPNLNLTLADNYLLMAQAQFVAELCINFEDISVKKKRVTNIPPVLCQSISAVTQELTEYMAKTADAEMVQYMILLVSSANSQGPVTKDESIPYDENFVLTRRHFKMEEFLAYVGSQVMALNSNQPGIVRHEARTMFISAVKKSLEMFMTKHNQVLTVGNSRLGRVKIPTCIACDRPLIDKVSLETAASQAMYSPGADLNGEDDNSMVSSYGAVSAHNSLQPLKVNNKIFMNRAKGAKPTMEIEGDTLKLPRAVSPTDVDQVKKSQQRGNRKVDFDKMPDLRSSN